MRLLQVYLCQGSRSFGSPHFLPCFHKSITLSLQALLERRRKEVACQGTAMESVRTAFIYLIFPRYSVLMRCQNHTSLVNYLDGAEHSYGLETARLLPSVKLVFLTLLVITDRRKSFPTCVIQPSCKSALSCLWGRRTLPSARKESCLLSSYLMMLGLWHTAPWAGCGGGQGYSQSAFSDVRKFIVFNHPFLREFSPPKIRENPNAKNIYMEKKTPSAFMWYQGQATLWWQKCCGMFIVKNFTVQQIVVSSERKIWQLFFGGNISKGLVWFL